MKKRDLSPEDVADIISIAQELSEICKNSKKEDFFYDVKSCAEAILEIINGPTGTVEKMF